MQTIKNGCVVGFNYKLTNSEGQLLDQSKSDAAFEYLHGYNNIIPGLEKQLEGLKAGDKKNVLVQPEDGYGLADENRIFSVPKSNFPQGVEIEVGMQFQSEGPEGTMVVAVTSVTEDTVNVDANHPLAGQTLHFDVEIVAVRAGTEDELSHGHSHGPGGIIINLV